MPNFYVFEKHNKENSEVKKRMEVYRKDFYENPELWKQAREKRMEKLRAEGRVPPPKKVEKKNSENNTVYSQLPPNNPRIVGSSLPHESFELLQKFVGDIKEKGRTFKRCGTK